jgi:hypothetical protein
MRLSLPTSRLPLMVASLAVMLASATPALADVGETIILRCTHNESLSGFSQSAYRQALKEMSADVEEYSPCGSEIRRAQLAAASGLTSTQGAPEAVALNVTPSEQQAITQARRTRPPSLKLRGLVIEPGVVHTNIASVFRMLPTPLLATLGLALAGLLLAMRHAFRKWVRARG